MASPEDLDPVLADLAQRIRAALVAAGLPEADAALERPRDPDHGDWATAVALRLAKPARQAPRQISQALIDHLDVPDAVVSFDIAGPGFVNFRLAPAYWADLVRNVIDRGESYGRRTRPDDQRERINVEFVSANPTGPLHAGAGRWAATGDALAALLEADGHDVDREYYVNDAGEQVRRFGESLLLTFRGRSLGEQHYQGDYIGEVVEQLRSDHGDDFFTTVIDATVLPGGEVETIHAPEGALDGTDSALAQQVGAAGIEQMRAWIQATLHAMGVDYDTWFSERQLHDSGEVEQAIARIRELGHVYAADGATFVRTTDFGDDKDRVVLRSDGRPTYFAADCAYLFDKWERGYTRLYYLLGADHHGYVGRLHAAAQCLGIPADRVEIRIGQMVNLLRGGEPVKMSKRAGMFITLDEVISEVGVDVARYHFLRQGLDTTVEFDLDVVTQQSMENPVYYVQYAHARIASLLRAADDSGFDHGLPDDVDGALLTHPAELELLRRIAAMPEAVSEAAEGRATQRLARHAEELAGSFHRFYAECRVLVDDVALGRSRYWLATAAKQVLGNELALLRVSAPERM